MTARAAVFSRPQRKPGPNLTPRQSQCVRALEIIRRSRVIRPRERIVAVADALQINPRTVRTHLDKARQKGWG